jgi:hypothetical protein
MPRGSAILVVLAVSLALPVSPAAADTVFSIEPAPPKISAAGGAVAWSTFDAADGVWFLTIRRNGVVARPPVAPRAVPFDVDLGRDARGRLVATYSRCEREPRVFAATGRGCDLYAYDLDGGRERRLAGASTPGASEYLPSMGGGRLAFARVYERRRGPAGVQSRLYFRPLAGGPATRLRGGTGNRDDRTGPTALDFDGRRLAFAWDVHGPAGMRFPYGVTELRIDDLRGPRTLVEQVANSGISAATVLTPALVDERVLYGTAGLGETTRTGNALYTYDLSNGRRGVAEIADRRVAGVAADGAAIYTVTCLSEYGVPPGSPRCEIALRDDVTFTDPDRQLAAAPRASTVSGFKGWLAFSAYDPSAADYRLTLRRPDGTLVPASVPPRQVPFDVDLGPGPSGRLLAVYSRCATEPRLERDGMPIPGGGRGCDIYRYDVGLEREARVPTAGRAEGSEFLPSVWGTRLAFARRDGETTLQLGRLTGGRTVRVAGGLDGDLGPRALDLSKQRIAFVCEHRRRGGALRSEVRLAGPTERVLARARGEARFASPGFDRGVLSWVVRRTGPSLAIRYDLSTGTRQTLVLPDPATGFVATTALTRTGIVAYGRLDAEGWSLRAPSWLPLSLP